MGENWLSSHQGVNKTNLWSCDPTSWNERVTCFLSHNNASSKIRSLLWLYHANRLVVLPYISTGENWLCSNQGVHLTNKLSCDMYSWNEWATCVLSLNNASSIISSLVWLYHANRLVVPSHTFLWVKIGYLPTKVLIKQTCGVAILLHGTNE